MKGGARLDGRVEDMHQKYWNLVEEAFRQGRADGDISPIAAKLCINERVKLHNFQKHASFNSVHTVVYGMVAEKEGLYYHILCIGASIGYRLRWVRETFLSYVEPVQEALLMMQDTEHINMFDEENFEKDCDQPNDQNDDFEDVHVSEHDDDYIAFNLETSMRKGILDGGATKTAGGILQLKFLRDRYAESGIDTQVGESTVEFTFADGKREPAGSLVTLSTAVIDGEEISFLCRDPDTDPPRPQLPQAAEVRGPLREQDVLLAHAEQVRRCHRAAFRSSRS
jgi:hypothetical protein